MPRGSRNPRNGGKRRMKAPDLSDHDSSALDSDFVIDLDDEEFEDDEEEVESMPVPPPPPPAPALAVGEIGGVGSDRRRKRRYLNKKSKAGKDKGKSPLFWEMWEEENEKWVDDFLAEELHREQWSCPRTEISLAETVEPSPDIILPLLRFQKEWLAWALKQEDSHVRGGILADEMGMGKTIQAISLVLTARFLQTRTIGGATSSDMGSSSMSSLPRTKCTLVICPVVAVIQWVGEIERYTKQGSTRVLVYHGAKRSNTDYDFNNFDFVLTTYSTIESDYRKHMMPPKLKCEYCDKSFYPNKMKVHLKYYCGPYAQKTEKQSKQVSKKKKYSSADDEKCKGKRKGGHKSENQEEFLSSSEDEKGSSEGKSILHSWKWQRIILDEAVDHPYLVIYSKTAEMPDGSKDDTVKDNCGICHDPAEDLVMEEIRGMVENDGSAKGIVFSQFTSFLDLIGFSLRRSGIKCVQLVGSMSIPEREKAIQSFTDDVDCKIFLMSLKAGGVALNLTVASYVSNLLSLSVAFSFENGHFHKGLYVWVGLKGDDMTGWGRKGQLMGQNFYKDGRCVRKHEHHVGGGEVTIISDQP
ncbi:putative ATP-dependent helicase rhp16 [Cocos nucifera]|uniref:Putative ATP-dependent helicase rhp16 n=1 Tax=Cocos nucifera TaxID=13894 RepID=A0A8K0ICF1_COCNU|nr:putative ATP-dependent helicase rhp16 [Cocos nucifera]